MTVNLLPHQEKAVGSLADGKILCGGVGSGKSLTAIAYYTQAHPSSLLYIITTAKKRDSLDWQKEAARYALTTSSNGGVVTIDSWNNIHKYKEVENAFFIFDEQRLVGSGAWVKSFLKIAKKNSWILLSATPGDTWLDYIPVFVANGFYKNRTEFLRNHVVFARYSKWPKIDRFIGTGTLRKHRDSILVDMPHQKHTIRISHIVECEYDAKLMDKAVKDRWNPYDEQPIRDAGELFRVMRRVANSDDSRLRAILSIQTLHPRLIVFYNFNYELYKLRDLAAESGIPAAEWNGHKHEPLPGSADWLYLVQYSAGAEGWNCVATDAMCFYSLPYSYKLWEQSHGRIDRLDTSFVNLHYYTLQSNARIEQQIAESLGRKQDFNEREHWREWD